MRFAWENSSRMPIDARFFERVRQRLSLARDRLQKAFRPSLRSLSRYLCILLAAWEMRG